MYRSSAQVITNFILLHTEFLSVILWVGEVNLCHLNLEVAKGQGSQFFPFIRTL